MKKCIQKSKRNRLYSIIKTEYALVKFQKAEVFQEVQFIVGSKNVNRKKKVLLMESIMRLNPIVLN